jgi:hypothetical protein
LSETAGLAAWLYIDLDDHFNARRHYQLAVDAAERGAHSLLAVYMLASLGHYAAVSGDARQGLDLVAAARSKLPRSAPVIARLWTDAVEAVALAACGDRRATVLLDRCQDRLSDVATADPMWPWLFHFDESKLAMFTATAAARLDQLRLVTAALVAVERGRSSPKQRAMLQLEHAHTLIRHRDVDQACDLAVQVLETGRTLGSHRVVHAVQRLRTALGARSTRQTVELDQRLAELYR